MILERANGTFGRICTVDSWCDELEGNAFLVEKLFQYRGTFVVEALQFGSQPGQDETIVDNAECIEDAMGGLVGHWLRMDRIAVVVVQHEELGVSGARW